MWSSKLFYIELNFPVLNFTVAMNHWLCMSKIKKQLADF
jgi:hypothetical protein